MRWISHSPEAWERPIDNGSDTWTFPPYGSEDFKVADAMELVDDFIQDRKAQLWALAANHVDSSDLHHGADFSGVTRELH
eukprot:1716343-Pyramimonas_sp.AAC.1